jgi:hypothetical protein
MCDLTQCLAILKQLQIAEVQYSLSGGGDDGTTTLEQVIDKDGNPATLPKVTIGISDHGQVVLLAERLDDIICNIPEGDWINNEGGYGTVTLRPQESDEDQQVECDMTYGEDESDYEDEDNVDFDDPGDLPGDGILIIDDSNLTKGETP